MTAAATPVPAGTIIGEILNGLFYGRTMLADGAGNEALGEVGASPGANTVLGRLKAIVTALAPLASSATSTKQDAIIGLIDGIETLLGTAATEATLAALAAKHPTLGQKVSSGSVSFVPASDAGMATSAKQDEQKALLATMTVGGPPYTITPGANALARQITGLAIKTGGTVVYRYPGDATDRTVDLAAGFYPFPATHILAATAASGLTGF